MELAENVQEKKLAFMRPESFDPRFGDSSYLLTDGAKSRIRGYLTTFAYMMLCGLLLLIGGGTFFIYESVAMNRQTSNDKGVSATSDGQAPFPASSVSKEKVEYAKEFQIAAFVFVGVGAVLCFVGAPLAGQFFAKYRISKNSERSPILAPVSRNDAKSKIYTKPETAENTEGSSKKTFTKKKVPKIKRSYSAWTSRSTRNLSKGFRFAAHRHPSLNQISIEGSEFFSRRSRGTSSSDSSDDGSSPIRDSPCRTEKNRSRSFIGFIRRMFSRADGSEEKAKFTNIKDGGIENETHDDISSEFKASNREEAEGDSAGTSTGIDSNILRSGTGGLYNLGEENFYNP